MTTSLKGASILVTRPVQQAENLCRLIRQHEGIPVKYPTLEIVGLNQQNLAALIVKKLSNVQWVVFTSANAVNFALQGNNGKIQRFAHAGVAAIGKATAQALEAAGLKVNLMPDAGYNSEALLAMPPMQQVKGGKVLIVRGQGGREELARELTARGASVEYLEVYKRIIPECDNAEIHELLTKGCLTAIVVTSGEALENLLTMVGINFQNAMKTLPLVVISARIRELAVRSGFNRITVSADPSDTAIINAVMTAINEDKSG